LVASIADQIAHLPPDRLLQRAWWEYAAVVLGVGDKKFNESDQLAAARMVDYVQSVVASVKPEVYEKDVGDDDWNRLKADVTALFTKLTLEYQICLTAHRKAQDPELDMELDEFRFRAEILWLNIRGKRYQTHERLALLDVLAPHSDILVKLFGIDAKGVVGELDKILAKLTRGLMDAMQGLSKFRDDTLNQVENLARENSSLNFEDLMKMTLEDPDFAARRDKVVGEVFGLDLFDVGKSTVLPRPLIEALSWLPGEDDQFFAEGDFAGWPLRIWPIMKRPFIQLDGRVFCFDVFSLFDNIYRVLRRIIVARDPSYSGIWNDRQKAISEELPFTYLSKLLPGAVIHRPIYYQWSTGTGPVEWHEADGILIFEDHLFVVEVKAGAFTYTSPADDLSAHLESLRNLLQAPARQGSRLVDYVESAPEVPIYDERHNEIGRLRRSDFRHVTVCAVTLDPFTSFAARAQHLASLGISVGNRPVWPISIDDLRVYSELFDDPLIFLHFVEQRMRAAQSQFVDLDDEMDHLGLYIVQNNYSQHAADLMANKFDRLTFDGYRTPIDDYYSAVAYEETPALPRQPIPRRLDEIIKLLPHTAVLHRSELTSFLLDAGGDFRDTFDAAIEEGLHSNRKLSRARPFSIYGEMAMTLYVWSPSAPRSASAAAQHTRTVLAGAGEVSRPLIELEYDNDDRLMAVHFQHMGLAGLATEEVKRIEVAAQSLKRERVRKASLTGKVRRNEPCPCGSGLKFKRCHGAS
jgi:preprotein translocase subunit SecA